MNYNKKVWILITFTTLFRLMVGGTLELGNDEVYYQTYAQHLQWNYFDHPPMVALLIRLTTYNLFFNQEFYIRLGSVLCAAAGTWIIFTIGCMVNNVRTGWIAAILYNTSFYTSVIAGIFILPDSPQVIFWLLSIYFMVSILDAQVGTRKQNISFIFLGVSIGMCIMSKVHGIFLWFEFGVYILLYRRELLKTPMLWLSGLISIAIISPIYLWNLENNFITYTYHQSRINFWNDKPDLDRFLQQVLGSIFYSNPVNFIIYICTLWVFSKRKKIGIPKYYPLFLWLSLPLIVILLWTSLFNETLPHWSGPAYLSLMLLAASWLDKKTLSQSTVWLKTAGWVYGAVVIFAVLSIHFLPFRIGNNQLNNLGKGDITLDLSGWKEFALRFDSIYRKDVHKGIMIPNSTIISDYWFPAGHLDHYYGIPNHRNLLAFGPINNIHQFAWLNQRRPRLSKGSDAYFIYPSNYYGPPDQKLKNEFMKVDDSLLIPQFRNSNVVRYFVIYRLHNFKGDSLDYLIPGIH
ncbi:MAG TPA: glycosyltransferase family 39 protein [Puia sp.]